MKLRKFNAATALGSLTATVALLAGLSSAHAQAPGAGSYPGSILIPGTNTSFKVGGYVKGDYVYDFGQQQPRDGGISSPGGLALDNDNGTPGTKPGGGHSIHGTSQISAAESRFNIETRTPTGYGELKTYIEGDFTDPNGLTHSKTLQLETNSTGFRLRYAYGTLGPWLVGQYNSVFRDSNSEPETLDFGGEQVAGATRQPQFRYTYDAGNGLLFAVAAENPQVQWFDATNLGSTTITTLSTGQGNKIPDFTGAVTYNAPWGHVAGRAVLRDLYDHNGCGSFNASCSGGTSSVGTQAALNTFGWGLGVSGDVKTFGKDDFTFQINGGDGIGRYLQNYANVAEFVVGSTVPGTTNLIHSISGVGGMLSYQHWWTDTLRSTASGSYVKIFVSDAFAPAFAGLSPGARQTVTSGLNDTLWISHVNLIWSPVPQVDTGIEFIYSHRRVVDGQTGTGTRV
ncbi:MAG: DcaP family trimeric outer membrane transporter, partial [Mycobacterium sp.]